MSDPGATVPIVTAEIWTAIGLLVATSLGTLFYLGARIDSLGGRMDAGFAHVDARFDHMDGRFDSIEARLDAINARIDAHLERHAG